MNQYAWIVYMGGIFSFIASMGIGANDVANSFATSVGAKSLTIKQAVILACIFETGGAILMGSHVTDTIRKGITDYQCFEDYPELLMYGCMWVIFSVASWLFIASYFEMPVSTTHSCVGGMIGMTIALAGTECVIWYIPTQTFPYVGGVSGIIMSWFISPVFSGIISSILYYLTRLLVLRHSFSSKRMNYLYPLLVGSTLTINTFFIIYKGAKGLGLDKIQVETALAISFGTGICSAIITYPLVPRMKNYVTNKILKKKRKSNSFNEINKIASIELDANKLNIKSEQQLVTVSSIHENAEKFDEKIEEAFKYLQIFTAICDSFSHGANDVANAVGPFAAIYTIYISNGELSKKADMDDNASWILGMGGVGIAVGLIVYGKKIIYAIGEKLCKITPSRGSIIELSSALVIIVGSRLKIPLSTTHCQIGATVGVGILEKGCFNGVNRRILIKTIFGWIITCGVVGTTTAILVLQGVYSPSIVKCNISGF